MRPKSVEPGGKDKVPVSENIIMFTAFHRIGSTVHPGSIRTHVENMPPGNGGSNVFVPTQALAQPYFPWRNRKF